MELLDEMSSVISFRTNGDIDRILEYATSKWPNLKNNSSALVKELLRDWEQWDNVNRGKSALMIYEAWLTRKMVEELAGSLKVDTGLLIEKYSMHVWEAEYRSGKENYNLISKESDE